MIKSVVLPDYMIFGLRAYPSDLTRTKNWGTETLTDADLEGQLDLIIAWVMASLNSSTGHTHDGSNKGAQIPTAGIEDDAITDAKMGILSAKGDILGFSTLPVRLGVGANETILEADSSEATGVKWGAKTPAMQVKVGTFTRDNQAATGTQDVTGLGFTPKAIWFTLRSSNAGCKFDGFSDGTTDRGSMYSSSGTPREFAKSVVVETGSGARQDGTVSALASGQFTVSWTKVGSPTAGTSTISYIAIG